MTSAAVPALAAAQGNPSEYGRGFLLIAKVNAITALPFLALTALGAPALVPWLLGPQWGPSVPYFQLLALSGIPKTLVGILGTHLIASGASRRYLLWGSWHAAVLLIGVVVTIPFGPIWVAVSLVASNWLVFIPSVVYVFRGGPIGARAFLRTFVVPIGFAGVGVAAAIATRYALGLRTITMESFVAEAGVFCLAYCMQVFVDPELRSTIAALWNRIRGTRKPAQGS
jgi:polysaccharide transporter, PST family